MENKKDLGKLFKDRLAQVEAEPNINLWDSIEKTLDQKRRRKRGFLFLWSGVTILLGVLLTAYFSQTTNSEIKQSPEIEVPITLDKTKSVDGRKMDTNAIDSAAGEHYDGSITREHDDSKEVKGVSAARKNPGEQQDLSVPKKTNLENGKFSKVKKRAVGNNTHELNIDQSSKKKKPYNQNQEDTVADATGKRESLENNNESANKKGQEKMLTEEEQQKDSISRKNKAVLKLIKKPETEIVKAKKEDSRKMLISLQGSPVYYDYISKGNSFENDLAEGQSTGTISSGYGGLLNIPIADKMTFRLGYRILNTRSTIKNASSSTSASGNAAIFTSDAILRNGNTIPNNLLQSVNSGDFFTIEQKSSYSEFPLEFTYALSAKKLRLDAIGGISFQLLGKNTISIENSSGSVSLGSSNYLKKVSITPNIGLGIRYPISKRVRLDLEPTLRYQFNAFEKGYTNQRPFMLGVYAGFSIKL